MGNLPNRATWFFKRRWQRYGAKDSDIELLFQRLEELKGQSGHMFADGTKSGGYDISALSWKTVGVERMEVPGGWLVRTAESRSFTFLPDSEHTWDSEITVPDYIWNGDKGWHFRDKDGNEFEYDGFGRD